jgi:hypothetical protein
MVMGTEPSGRGGTFQESSSPFNSNAKPSEVHVSLDNADTVIEGAPFKPSVGLSGVVRSLTTTVRCPGSPFFRQIRGLALRYFCSSLMVLKPNSTLSFCEKMAPPQRVSVFLPREFAVAREKRFRIGWDRVGKDVL